MGLSVGYDRWMYNMWCYQWGTIDGCIICGVISGVSKCLVPKNISIAGKYFKQLIC